MPESFNPLSAATVRSRMDVSPTGRPERGNTRFFAIPDGREVPVSAKEEPWKPFPTRLPKTPKEIGEQDEEEQGDNGGGRKGKRKEKQIQKNVPKKK